MDERHDDGAFADCRCDALDGRWINLGRDFAAAMAAYGRELGPGRQCTTLGDVIEKYLIDVLPHKAEKTRADQVRQLDRLAEVFGHMRPDQITAQHCYRYMDSRSAYPTAARHEVSLLGHVFAKAIRWGAATRNPVRGVEKPRSKPRNRYVTDAEYLAAYKLASPQLPIAMDLALLTGLRRG